MFAVIREMHQNIEPDSLSVPLFYFERLLSTAVEGETHMKGANKEKMAARSSREQEEDLNKRVE